MNRFYLPLLVSFFLIFCLSCLEEHNSPPSINDQTFTVPENCSVDVDIAIIEAIDPDSDQSLTFRFIGVGDDFPFKIDLLTGTITLKEGVELDFETTQKYTFTVEVRESSSDALSAQATITIIIENVLDMPLLDEQEFSVPETAEEGTFVGKLEYTGADDGHTVLFEIKNGNDNSVFRMDQSGNIYIEDASYLNYEEQEQFIIGVKAEYESDSTIFSTSLVVINIEDINEAPEIQEQTFRVSEKVNVSEEVGTITATDPDQGQQLAFCAVDPEEDLPFSIGAGTGVITVSDTLNYESINKYVFDVEVKDNGIDSLSASSTITIIIEDSNDAPEIEDQSFLVVENSLPGTEVGIVIATDSDEGQVLSYLIPVDDGVPFSIDPSTGVIVLTGSIDFETKNRYEFDVLVKDNGAEMLSSSAKITIVIEDTNDQPDISQQTFQVDEDSEVGIEIGEILAKDQDQGQELTFIYAGDAPFVLNSATGILSLSKALDYEQKNKYELTVEVTDNGPESQSSSSVITIIVNDVNESPEISDQSFEVSGDSSIDDVVGTVIASDPDQNQQLTYEFVEAGDLPFEIHQSTGLIRVSNLLDYESQNIYELQVNVHDNGDEVLSASATITIQVGEPNNAPVISAQSFQIVENSDFGSEVGKIEANDPDTDQELSYQITNAGTVPFIIDAKTGALTVSGDLNFESEDQYELIVEVTDNAPQSKSSSATIIVEIQDINEAPLVSDQSFQVLENSELGTLVGTIQAEDTDNGQQISYLITSGGESPFIVDEFSGEISVSGELDYESEDQYELVVKIEDDAVESLSSVSTITIYIENVPEIPTDGMVAYYPFDGNANDESGNDYHGSVYGSFLVQGHLGESETAYHFDGYNDYIDIGNVDELKITGDMSISFWIKTESNSGVRGIITCQGGYTDEYQTNALYRLIFRDANYLEYTHESDSGTDHDTPLTGGSISFDYWHHVVVTRNASNKSVSLYVDVVSSGIYLYDNNPENGNLSSIRIGMNHGAHSKNERFFKGSLDELIIYDRVISEKEIQDLYIIE